MKRIFSILLTLAMAFVVFSGCKQLEKASQPTEETTLLTYMDDTWVLTLPKSKQEISLLGDAAMCRKEIVYEMVVAAEEKILQEIATYQEKPLLYVQYSEDYLWLCAEAVETIDPPVFQEQEDGTVITAGCNVDHRHIFFKEKIVPEPIYIMSIS